MYTITIPSNIKEFRVVIEDSTVEEDTAIDNTLEQPYYEEVKDTKFALLVGIDYKYTENELNGCINDSKAIIEKLNTWGFNQVVALNDISGTPDEQMPFMNNILREIDAIVEKANAVPPTENADIFFHYSGHGSYQKDVDGDEADGYDEVMCALDGNISDDILHDRFLAKLNSNVRVFMFTDCCHSGTIMDLAYTMNANGYVMETGSKNDVKAKVIMISGCRDDQTSADAYFENLSQYRGAATTAFLNTLKKFNDSGYADNEIDIGNFRYYIHDFLQEGQFTQKPVISMSYQGSFYDKALMFLQ